MRVIQLPNFYCTECSSEYEVKVNKIAKTVTLLHPAYDALYEKSQCKNLEKEKTFYLSDFSRELV